MGSAEDLGKRLLGAVEVVGLDEILHSLRLRDSTQDAGLFGLKPLDLLLQIAIDARIHNPPTSTTPPIVELMSLAPGGGKTHLLYHLSAQAVLPAEFSGKQTCVVIIDADGKFSVERLVAQLELLIRRQHVQEIDTAITDTILTCLKHIHIFRPQTLASTCATIDGLTAYLFNSDRHHSFDRALGFIALDSASAFYWEDRAETEDAAFLASTTAPGTGRKPPPPSSAYTALASALKAACKTFNCPAVLTTWYLGPMSAHQHSRSFRPSLPSAFANLPTLRFVVQRLPVRKFPAGIRVSDALREAGDRQRAVEESKFECFVNEWGMDERILQRLKGGSGGCVFGFRISGGGLVLPDEGL